MKKQTCPKCGKILHIVEAGYHYNQGFCEKCQEYHYVDGLLSVMPLKHLEGLKI